MSYQPPQPWQQPNQPQYGPGPVSGPPGYPAPYPPPMSKKKSHLGLILGIVGGVVALCCVGGVVLVLVSGPPPATQTTSNNQGAPADPDTSGDATAQATTAAPPAPVKAAGLNQPVRDGKFQFTVTAVKCGITKVGDSYLGKTAQGQFCEVSVTVTNIGNEPRTFDGGNQVAYGPGDVKYDDDTAAELYANDADQTFLQDINPGNSVKGLLVFDIPKAAKLIRLEMHDSAFSGGAVVALG